MFTRNPETQPQADVDNLNYTITGKNMTKTFLRNKNISKHTENLHHR